MYVPWNIYAQLFALVINVSWYRFFVLNCDYLSAILFDGEDPFLSHEEEGGGKATLDINSLS